MTWTKLGPEQGNSWRGHFATDREALEALPHAILGRVIASLWVHQVDDGVDVYVTEGQRG